MEDKVSYIICRHIILFQMKWGAAVITRRRRNKTIKFSGWGEGRAVKFWTFSVSETWQNEAWPTSRSVPYVSWREGEKQLPIHTTSLWKKKNEKTKQLAGVGFQESCRESVSAKQTWLHSHIYVFITFVRGRLMTGTSHFSIVLRYFI